MRSMEFLVLNAPDPKGSDEDDGGRASAWRNGRVRCATRASMRCVWIAQRSDHHVPRHGEHLAAQPFHAIPAVDEKPRERLLAVLGAEHMQMRSVGKSRFRGRLHFNRQQSTVQIHDEVDLFAE
jgi:hypothetical protein